MTTFFACQCGNPVAQAGALCPMCTLRQQGGMPVVEPSADLRTAAHNWREIFVAFMNAGFTEAQSLHMIGVAMSTGIMWNLQNGGGETP